MKVIIFCAMSLDGKITKGDSSVIDWTPKADKQYFASETKKAGAVIMGNETFKAMGKPLKDRLNIVMTTNLSEKEQVAGVEYTNMAAKDLIANLAGRGYEKVFVIGGSKTNTRFLSEGLVDEIWLSVVPSIFGSGKPIVGEAVTTDLKLIEVKNIDKNCLCLKYQVVRI